jgi:hypothetical protein
MRIKDFSFALHKHGDEYTELQISDMDIAGTTKYYGFLSSLGWVIMKWNTTTNAFTYASGGNSGYSTAWTNRATTTTFATADLVF